MRAAFRRLMRDRIQHAAIEAYNDGQRTFLPAVSRRARIDRGQRMVVNLAGEEVLSEALVFIEGPVTIDPRDAIFLKDDAPTNEDFVAARPLLRVDHVADVNGQVDHAEVFV